LEENVEAETKSKIIDAILKIGTSFLKIVVSNILQLLLHQLLLRLLRLLLLLLLLLAITMEDPNLKFILFQEKDQIVMKTIAIIIETGGNRVAMRNILGVPA
jgi:hypothetical protein